MRLFDSANTLNQFWNFANISEDQGIRVEYEEQIVRLVLNRPKQLNALNDDIRRVIATTLN